jgi:hypothetical protein
MRKVVISAGHALHVRGARGSPVPPELDEYDQNVRVVNRVFELMPPEAAVAKFIDTTSTSQNQNLNAIVNYHNSKTRDLDVSVHFNAGGSDALMGTEVLYKTDAVAKPIAAATSAAMAATASWPNRGAKYRSDLFFLNSTSKPAILIEVCFCDSQADSARYTERFEALCQTIAQEIADAAVAPPEPIEPPVEPPVEAVAATVDITVTGNVVVTVNGQVVHGSQPSGPTVCKDIFATYFGGAADPNNSAYDGHYLNDTDLYVALPFKLQGTRPKVKVTNHATGDWSYASIEDVGPWMTTDDYWIRGVRPVAEVCYNNKEALPSGPNEGSIPANPAGIDLSPALLKALRMSDNGLVDWEFVEMVA